MLIIRKANDLPDPSLNAPELQLSVWQHVVLLPVESVPVLVVAHAARHPFE